jgi:hypothetical protein
MSAADLIASFALPVTIKRFNPGDYVNGKWVDGGSEEFEDRMSVQPMVGKDLLNLPEAQRSKRLMVGYIATQLRTVSEADKYKADQVFYDGVWFEVQTVELWKDGIESLDHWKVILAETNA